MARQRSHETKRVLQTLLDAPGDETWGFQVMEASGLSAGTTYVILRRLRDEGLLDWRWEAQAQAAAEGRPPRRYYHLTAEGRRLANRETLAERDGLRALVPGWGRI